MGVYAYKDEYSSPISPERLFKASVVDDYNVLPKVLPQFIKSIELIHGDGGVGGIKQINFVEGRPVIFVKNRVDELSEETLAYNYTTIEGGALEDKYESTVYEVKFEGTAEGGCIIKKTAKYDKIMRFMKRKLRV